MVHTTTNAKRIATELHGAEEGDELSLAIDGKHVRGTVRESRDDIEGHDLELALDADESAYTVYVDYNGPQEHGHFDSKSRNYDIFALRQLDVHDDTLDVTALVNWEDDYEVPDKNLDALAEEDADAAEEMEAELTDAISSLNTCITEIQEIREAYRDILDGDATLADFEEQLVEMEMRNGGELALDEW